MPFRLFFFSLVSSSVSSSSSTSSFCNDVFCFCKFRTGHTYSNNPHRFTPTFLSFSNKQIVNITISPLNGFGMLSSLRDSAFTVYELSHLLFIFSVTVYFIFYLFIFYFYIMKNVLNKNGKYADIMNFKTTQSNLKRSGCIFSLSSLNSTAFVYDNWYTRVFRGETKLNTNVVVLIDSTYRCVIISYFTYLFSTSVY